MTDQKHNLPSVAPQTAKHPGGRPSKYDPKYCQELIDFFDIEPYADVEIPHMGPTGEFRWMDYKRMANRLPTLRGYAKKIGVHVSNVYDWVNPKASSYQREFHDAFTYAQELRKWFLIENALNGCYNPIFAKFTAINITDMRDRNETDITSGGKPLPAPIYGSKSTETV